MEHVLELNLISAKDIKNHNLFSRMDVYAVVLLSGDPQHNQKKVKTSVDREGGTNPTWNFPIEFTVNETLARQNRLTLEIYLRCDRALAVDKDVGHVHVPIIELLNHPGDRKSFQHITYQVRTPSGKPKGALNFSYKFGDVVADPAKKALETAPPSAADHKLQPAVAYPPPAEVVAYEPPAEAHKAENKAEPVMAYPPPAEGSSSMKYGAAAYSSQPQQQQYAAGYGYPPAAYGGYGQPGYGYPPQAGYGYQPQQAGYGYPAEQGGYGYPPHGYPGAGAAAQDQGQGQSKVQKPKKGKMSKLGLGLGAGAAGLGVGLLGGTLGGLLVGDVMSDVADIADFNVGFDAPSIVFDF